MIVISVIYLSFLLYSLLKEKSLLRSQYKTKILLFLPFAISVLLTLTKVWMIYEQKVNGDICTGITKDASI